MNWFRKDKDGKFLWPGFGENMRVLKWIVDRAHGRVGGRGDAVRLGAARRPGLNLSGLDISQEAVDEATSIKEEEWKAELESQEPFFESLGLKAPEALTLQRKLLISRLGT